MIPVDAFYAWALPETMTSPTARGLLAEYLVRRAVGETTQPAEDWHYVDIECKNGLKIEVKCSAYLQPRKDNTLAKIGSPKFSISQKKGAWCNREWDWRVRLRFVAHAAARQWKKSATRLFIWQHRIAMIALAPSTDQRLPLFLSRSTTTVRQPPSTRPLPQGRPCRV